MTKREQGLFLMLGVCIWLLSLGMWVSAQTSVISGGGGAATSVSAAAFPLLAPNGTAAAPSYSFSSDTNAGMYYGGSNIVAFTGDGAGAAAIAWSSGAYIRSGAQFAFTASATEANSAADTGWERVAPGVSGSTNGSTGEGWVQNEAGDQFLAANHTNATATPTNITDLTTSLTAGRKYAFRFVAQVDNSTDADGLRFDFDGGTATATDFRVTCKTFANNAVAQTAQTTAIATDITLATLTGTGEFECDGSFEPSGTGTFIPRAAVNAVTTGTLTVFRGSHLLTRDLP